MIKNIKNLLEELLTNTQMDSSRFLEEILVDFFDKLQIEDLLEMKGGKSISSRTILAVLLRKYGLHVDSVDDVIDIGVLRLTDKKLKKIPTCFGNLRGLCEIYLGGNMLNEFPTILFKLESLKKISLEGNAITKIPSGIISLKDSLSRLDLSNNRLKSIPKEIGFLTELRILYLDDNELTSIPAEIGFLKEMETLSVDGNKLASIPDEIGDLKSLRNLSVSGNEIRKVPIKIFLGNIMVMDLSKNNLTEVYPNGFYNPRLDGLVELNLMDNPLRSLPDSLYEIKNLVLIIPSLLYGKKK